MRVICAWCQGVVNESSEAVSHGICPECAMKMLARLPAHYLASIADADGTVTLFSGHKLPVPGWLDRGEEETRGRGDEETWEDTAEIETRGPGDQELAADDAVFDAMAFPTSPEFFAGAAR